MNIGEAHDVHVLLDLINPAGRERHNSVSRERALEAGMRLLTRANQALQVSASDRELETLHTALSVLAMRAKRDWPRPGDHDTYPREGDLR